MPAVLSSPVFVVKTTVWVRVAAVRCTRMEARAGEERSRSSHLEAASSPWRMPVRSATKISVASRMPSGAAMSFEASSWERARMGRGLGGNDDIDGGSGDNLYGGSSIDLIYGGRGDDLVVSDEGGGELYGGPGRDTIRGTVGLEGEVYGNSGNDTINTQDGVFDYVDCGLYADYAGTALDYDTADVDVGLDFTVDCENRF